MVIDGFTLFGSWPGLPYDHSVETLVRGLERYKVGKACALSSKGIFFDAAAGNETTWSACQEDPRLVPIGVTDPRCNGEEQVDYCQRTGFKLMAMFPDSQGWTLQSLSVNRVLRKIDDAKLPLMIEAGRDGDATAVLKAVEGLSMPVILLDVSLHTLTEALDVLRARPQTFLSTRLLCGGDTIELLVQTLGADRLIFTSRFPISCFSSSFLVAKFAGIGDADRSKIMGDTMETLLT